MPCAWLARLTVALAAASAFGCGSGTPPTAAPGELCGARLRPARLSFDAAPEIETPESRLAVDIRVSTTRLARELGARVPRVLAHAERVPVGTPGEASYRVARGDFAVTLSGERLVVATPVSVSIAVCKPLGPICPSYGRCSAELAARASVPLVLDARYELGASRVELATTRGCVLSPIGLDVTPELERTARQQVAESKRRIDDSLPSLGPAIRAGWQLVQTPVGLGNTPCARISPERLAQQRPSLESGTLVTRLAVFGHVGVEDPCPPPDAHPRERALPAPELHDDVPAGLALEVPVRLDWGDVSAALTRSLAAATRAGDATRIVRAEARGARLAGTSVVALALTVEGDVCGEAWVTAEPWYDAARARVRLRRVALAPSQPEASALELPARVEESAEIALPVELGAAPAALEGLVKMLISGAPESVAVDFQVEPPRVGRVLVAPQALVPLASLRGRAVVAVK